MNTAYFGLQVFASAVVLSLAALFIGGQLFRRDLVPSAGTGSGGWPLLRDLRSVKETLIAFFAHSEGTSGILRLLAGARVPLAYRALVHEGRLDAPSRGASEEFPAGAKPWVLGLMAVSGLIRLTRHGFSITEVGREVHGQIASSKSTR